MILNWYLDADGTTHRLHTTKGWSTHTVLAEQVPTRVGVPLGTVAGEAFFRALTEVIGSLGPFDEQSGPRDVHIATVAVAGKSNLVISAALGGVAVARHVPWTPTDQAIVLPAVAGIAPDMNHHGDPGSVQISIGVDGNWNGTLALTGGNGPDALPLLRRDATRAPSTFIPGQTTVHGTVDRRRFADIVNRVPGDIRVTIGIVPGKLLVRTDSGLVGAIDADVAGSPLQGQFDSMPLQSALHHLPRTADTIRLGLLPSGDRATLRATDAGTTASFSLLRPGWMYT